MLLNKSPRQVEQECSELQAAMRTLKNRQMSLSLLQQFQRQGVSRADSPGFVAGNGGTGRA